MSTVVNVPSAWIFAYIFGLLLCFYRAVKSDNYEFYFLLVMVYTMILSIGLRVYYAP